MMTNLHQLFSQIAREQDALLAAGHRRGLVRRHLEGSQSVRRKVGWSRRTALVLAGGCTAASSAAAFWWVRHQELPLTATVGASSARIANGAWFDAPETSSLPLRFSDGTRVEVAPHARMRLLELGQNGAKLVLESGRAGFEVVHGEKRRWELRAGRFIVRVTGTRFDVSWWPNEDQFELVLNEGQVELAGCGFADGRKLVAGQTVRASCHDGAVQVAYGAAPPASRGPAAPIVSVPAASAAETTKRADKPMPPTAAKTGSVVPKISRATPPEDDWKLLAKQGRYADALAVADRWGFGTECARADAETLALLADVARHAKKPHQARQAYSLLRQRFIGTSQAGLATFSLGVLEFDQWRAYAKAAAWFRAYIEENPRGPLLREARGRLMEALHRSGSDRARSVATDYLRDYPAGPYADLAQRIVQHH